METLIAAPGFARAGGLAARWVRSRAPKGPPSRALVVEDDAADRALRHSGCESAEASPASDARARALSAGDRSSQGASIQNEGSSA